MPNPASRALGLAVRALPRHWTEVQGFRPVLAETFTDIECLEGTCYRAADWLPGNARPTQPCPAARPHR